MMKNTLNHNVFKHDNRINNMKKGRGFVFGIISNSQSKGFYSEFSLIKLNKVVIL